MRIFECIAYKDQEKLKKEKIYVIANTYKDCEIKLLKHSPKNSKLTLIKYIESIKCVGDIARNNLIQ